MELTTNVASETLNSMPEKDDTPENLRCARTDGRRWRCKLRVMDGKKYCEDHFMRSKKKKKVKLEEQVVVKKKKKEDNNNNNSQNREKIGEKSEEKSEISRKRSASEALDETLRRLKLKKGDMQLELIREYLIRKVEKKKEKELEERQSGVKNIIKDLPNGLMAIAPPETPQEFNNVGPYQVKLGVNCKTIQQRSFRSKNVEPLPVCTMQLLPNVKEVVKVKKGKKRNCHWCRKSSYRILVKCKSCQKQWFCEDCIEERCFVKEEVRVACPVCLGICKCKACSTSTSKDVEHKKSIKDTEKDEKLQKLRYLLQILLPVLEKMNLDKSTELEIEAKMKGATNHDIPQVKLGCKNCICCNCNTSIVNLHRSCTSCSYSLCLSCCHELRQGKLGGSKENKIMYPNRKRACTSHNKLPTTRRQNSFLKKCSKSIASPTLPQNWNVSTDGRLCCPPKSFGGCDGKNILELRCLSPFDWDKELEASAKGIVNKFDFPDAPDVGSGCTLCRRTDNPKNGFKLLLETARRDESDENFLYYPTVPDLHVERLEHFQNHWSKGHPILVRNVIQVAANLSWDPITMFCSYLEKCYANKFKSVASKTTNYLDWFKVDLSRTQIFMGSLEGLSNAFMQREMLKVNGWLLPNLFQEYFPEHYAQIMNCMPLREYMDPISGLFNLAAKLPEDMPKPYLGPSVHIAYGEPVEYIQGHFVTRLSYDPYDVVNVLVHATDVSISKKKLNRLKTLLNQCTTQDHSKSTYKAVDQPLAFNGDRAKDVTGKSSLRSEITEEQVMQDGPGEGVHFTDRVAKASSACGGSSRGAAQSIQPQNMSNTDEQDSEFDSEATINFSGTYHRIENMENGYSFRNDFCGAQWDIFRRQDVPKLLEYLRRHSDESTPAYYSPMHVVHPILDNTFYFDKFQKMRLKQEFDIEPWTFEQKIGEAVIIPAGCPYQVKKLKSSVNVILEFISPESAPECIRLADEIRLLPLNHKAKGKFREVEKMTLCGISAAIKEIKSLTCPENMATSGKEEANS